MKTIHVFCFSFSILAPADRGQARPGRADPVAAASLFFFPLASMAKARLVAGLTLAFGPGFDPGLPWSGRVADARV